MNTRTYRWSAADRQAFADGDRLRAQTIQGRRRPGPSAAEWDYDDDSEDAGESGGFTGILGICPEWRVDEILALNDSYRRLGYVDQPIWAYDADERDLSAASAEGWTDSFVCIEGVVVTVPEDTHAMLVRS